MTVTFGDSRLPARFWSKVEQPDSGCWQFMNSISKSGYGSYFYEGRSQGSHRVAWMALVGPIPEGLVIDHLCRNRACCNPAHLEPVTSAENILRGTGFAARNARKTHCSEGHEFSPENLVKKKLPHRVCKICALDRYLANEERRSQRMGEMFAYGY